MYRKLTVSGDGASELENSRQRKRVLFVTFQTWYAIIQSNLQLASYTPQMQLHNITFSSYGAMRSMRYQLQ